MGLKRTRRIEIVHYRRLIVSDAPLPADDPKSWPSAVDILKKLSSLQPLDDVDDDELAGDHEIADDRLPRP